MGNRGNPLDNVIELVFDYGSMLDELRAAVAGLRSVDTSSMDEAELGAFLVELRQIENQLEAQSTRLTGEWDARKAWAGSRARTGASWLAFHARMPHATARSRVALARACREMPAAAGAWADGRVERAHVSALARAHTAATAEAYGRDEEMLVDKAQRLRFDDFCRVVSYWHQLADEDGAEANAEKRFGERRAYLSQTLGGMWVGDLFLDPIGGAIVAGTVGGIEQEFFEADCAEARARLGHDDIAGCHLQRTPAQRRADAIVEMATRARMAPSDGRRPAPLFTVLVDYPTVAGRVCELANGTAVTPGALVSWLTSADFERVVFDGPSRVIDVGATRRLFDGATRRAVEVRDRCRCFVPECDATERLQVDHVEPYSAGGRTVQSNGRVACDVHNRGRHRRSGGSGREPPDGPSP
jgi:hypothetical protein